MTHTFKHPKYWAELRKERRAQASKLTSFREGGPESRQAPSTNELDRDPGLGYNRINKTKPPLKVSAMSAVSKAGSFRAVSRQSRDVSLHKSSPGAVNLPSCEFSTTSSQDEEHKPSSPEPRGQASNPRNSVPGSGIQGTSESAQASLNRKQG